MDKGHDGGGMQLLPVLQREKYWEEELPAEKWGKRNAGKP